MGKVVGVGVVDRDRPLVVLFGGGVSLLKVEADAETVMRFRVLGIDEKRPFEVLFGLFQQLRAGSLGAAELGKLFGPLLDPRAGGGDARLIRLLRERRGERILLG